MQHRLLSLPLGFLSAVALLTVLAQACSSEADSGDDGSSGGLSAGGGGKSGGAGGGGGSGKGTGASAGVGTAPEGGVFIDSPVYDPDAFFVNDPPPPSCDGGPMMTPVIGGTPECPDDKNREGCPCSTPGAKAPCWPGYRKNRNRGICQDGTTTCVGSTEVGGKWSKCEGYVLPKPDGKTAKEKCQCFSGGQWKLENLSPCFVNKGDLGAISTINGGQCPQPINTPLSPPSQPFSKNTLTVDCAGHFQLCYVLRAGKAETASPSDCIMAKVCTEADYTKIDQPEPFPDLPSWATTTPEQIACAKQFATSGGYGEMVVKGVSVECDTIDEHVFNRVNYCSLACSQNPSLPECVGCMNGGSGGF